MVSVLLLILVLSLVVGKSLLSAWTENLINCGYHQSLQAAYAAEAGAQALLSQFRSQPTLWLEKKGREELGFSVFESVAGACRQGDTCLEAVRYDPEPFPVYAEAVIVGHDPQKKALSRVRALFQCQALGGNHPVPQVFRMGMVTAGRLLLQNPVELSGDFHAGQGHSLHPSEWYDRLRAGQYSVTQAVERGQPDYRQLVEIPSITEERFQWYRSAARLPGNRYLSGDQHLSLAGDQGGTLLMVEGNLRLKGEGLSGMIVVATGWLVFEGFTSRPPEGGVTVALVAGGDVVLFPDPEIAAVFWCNGSWKVSGSGKVVGTVVSQQDLRHPGGLRFEALPPDSHFFLKPLSPTYTLSLAGRSHL